MRLVFFGTPVFAVPALRALVRNHHEILAVVTQPPRTQGRGLSSEIPSPVMMEARQLGLPILTPARTKDPEFLAYIHSLSPDACVVAAYGGILPDSLLEIPAKGTWNIHPSLLPRWRGPSPVQRTIWAGDTETGVCIMQVVAEVDAGPVALVERTMIGQRETKFELEGRLAYFGADLLITALTQLGKGNLPAIVQDSSQSTYAGMFKAEEMEIKWFRMAGEIDRLVRAMAPAPGAYFMVDGQRVKVRGVVPVHHTEEAQPGTLLERIQGGAWRVACGSGSAWIGTVLPQGKSWMSTDSFLQGRRLKVGDQLA